MLLDIEKLKEITIKAGQISMKYYNKNYDILIKKDKSPVTEADLIVNDYIINSLQELYPNIAILSEENNHQKNLEASYQKRIFIIDPIDGTKSFIDKKSQFTINIGYVEDGQFVLGFIYAPILDILYYSDYQNSYKLEKNQVNILRKSGLRKSGNDLKNGVIQTSSMNKTENIKIAKEFENVKISQIIQSSSSYKFCLIADSIADFYPKRGHMKIWDVAAAFGILKFIDYQFLDLSGRKITFNKMIDDFSLSNFNLFRSEEVKEYIVPHLKTT